MEENNIYVYRARFQPFCRDHYEVIQGFWKNFVKVETDEEKPDLYLWAVRSLRTTALDVLRGDINGNILNEPEFFRHRPQFNPFRFAESTRIFRHDLHQFINDDKDSGDVEAEELESFKDWTSKYLHFVSIPFSIHELTAYWNGHAHIYEEDRNAQQLNANGQFHKIFSSTYPKTNYVLETSTAANHQESRQQSRMEIAKSMAARFRDTGLHVMPNILLPIFDNQDLDDGELLKACAWKYTCVYLDWFRKDCCDITAQSTNFTYFASIENRNVRLCAQNAFMYFAWIHHLQTQDNDRFNTHDYANEILNVEAFLKKRSTSGTVRLFRERINQQRWATLENMVSVEIAQNMFSKIQAPKVARDFPSEADVISSLSPVIDTLLALINSFVNRGWSTADKITQFENNQLHDILNSMQKLSECPENLKGIDVEISDALRSVASCTQVKKINSGYAKIIVEFTNKSGQ